MPGAPAAMCNEGDDRLAVETGGCLEEASHGRRRRPPPHGRPKEDHVVFVKPRQRPLLQRGEDAFLQLLPRLPDALEIAAGIGNRNLYWNNGGACGLVNPHGKTAGVLRR